MSTAEIALQNIRYGGRIVSGIKHAPLIVAICLVTLLSLVYVWPHIHMTQLEYQIAEQLSVRQKLLEERGRLKIDYATMKSQQRIEGIARTKLDMTYPVRDQVVYLK